MGDTATTLGVFGGPSLPSSDRIACDGVTYLPPAARGDVTNAAERFGAILLIDGVFHHNLAPAPKEVYAALQRVRLFGASSMGALRVAECAPYGATPLGIIARWYCNGTIDGDDEVALLTHPQTHVALTVPSVNVRYVAWLARRRAILTAQEADAFVRAARSVFYMDRTGGDAFAGAPPHAREAGAQSAQREGDLKRHDARFALRTTLRTLGLAKAIAAAS